MFSKVPYELAIVDAGEDAERKLEICSFYFSILIVRVFDSGYRNGCLRVK